MLVEVQVHDEDGWTIVSVVGELDLALAPRVRRAVVEALASAPAGCPRIVLDLAGVHFVDSSGLGIVLGALRRVRQAGGTLRVVVVEPQVVGVFELLGLDAIVDRRASVAAAVTDPVPSAVGSGSGSGPGSGSGGGAGG